MKKSKIICIVICTLMIVTVFPVVGLPTQTGETKNLNVTEPRNQPPGPAYAPMPSLDTLLNTPIMRQTPEKSAPTMDDVVISMIEQVDESIFLSYEENLTVNGPRPTESASCIAAAEYMYEQFQNMGLAVRYHQWSNGGYTSNNVEATLNGSDETSDDIYIICGHYDTVSSSPGADDDTSGTVAVLIAALIMSQYKFNHTIKFVAFSGEEEGLLGSQVYAQEADAQGWDIKGVLNCDMISYAITSNDGKNLEVYQNDASEWLYTYTMGVNTEYSEYIGPLTLHDAGLSGGSDHYYFWQYGFSALFYFEYTMTPYYHSPQDTIANINLTYAVKNTRLIIATLAELAEAGLLSNPPATPVLTGPNTGVINELYTYTAVTTEPDGENVYYFFDWGDGSNSGWLGPYSSGQQAAAQKSWNAAGNYTVRAKAKDINQVSSGWSTPLIVTIMTDRPPNTPTIHGPAEGEPGNSYLYTLTTIDLDGDMVYYYIDWGDGQVSEWFGPFNSGATASKNHQWAEEGTYTIQAKAKDTYGVESGWATLEVTMPVSIEKHQATPLQNFFQHINVLLGNLGLRLFRH
ncbi:MAG TPA: M20/M25/M40 family metallo-hydrolase [Candidatus Thermoplasmatota archaeon]|nr:M20/M25/M40 family metallo-hydrolase [Candidatus Thermoplasmatota archaeon]